MKFPFDELNMCDAEHVGWVKSQRDPELWQGRLFLRHDGIGDRGGLDALAGWGVRWLDLDNDGWKDLFVAQGHVLDTIELTSEQQPRSAIWTTRSSSPMVRR